MLLLCELINDYQKMKLKAPRQLIQNTEEHWKIPGITYVRKIDHLFLN